MSATTVQQMAEQVAGLMEARLKIGGADLRAKLRRGGRMLPRKVRGAAEALAAYADLAAHPKHQQRIDLTEAEAQYQTCMAYLRPLGLKQRRTDLALSMAGSIAFALLVVGGGFLAVMVWRGYL